VLEQAPARTCGPVERGAHAGAGLLAELVTPWTTQAGAWAETTCDELTATPIPSPPVPLGGRR